MKNRNTWTLPLVIDPIDTICVQIEVPNDTNHIAAFWGALEALNKAWNWQYTTDHKGSQTARVWQGYLDTASQNVRVGDNCMIDCNDIETCLLTSPTIAAINAAIASNTANITTNTNNIALNTTNIAANGANIVNNTNDIAQNTADIALHSTLITDNANEIIVNKALIAANTNNIDSNDAELADHETRILALESGGGGGGGGSIVTTAYSTLQTTNLDNSTAVFLTIPNSLYSHQFTYPNALITLAYRSKGTGSVTEYQARIKVNGVNSSNLQDGKGLIVQSVILSEVFTNIDTSIPVSIFGEHRTVKGGGASRVNANQDITITIIEYPTATFDSGAVTFDFGGMPYTLVLNQLGVVASGGNPDNCIRIDNPIGADWLGVEFDFGVISSMTDIDLDFYAADTLNLDVVLYVDGIFKNIWTLSGANDTWLHFNKPVAYSGQIVKINVVPSGLGQDFRVDNIKMTI